jgi:hypothetical protein
MSEKKGKALVMKLIDDLMNNDDVEQNDDQAKTKAAATRVSRGKPPAEDVPVDVEISDLVQVPETDSTEAKDEEILDLYQKNPDATQPTDALTGRSSSSAKADETVRINESKITKTPPDTQKRPSRPPEPPTEPKPAVGRYSPLKSGGFSSATEAALEQLAAAGETLRRRADELATQAKSLQTRLSRTTETKDQEIEILRNSQHQRDKEVGALKLKIEELEMRLSTNIQKIRVRERELENRLELVKMEGTALVRNKDEIILDLKRQLDQLNLELENYRNKGQELNKQLGDKQEMLRRTVKALRLALSMLEGDEEAGPLKKVK